MRRTLARRAAVLIIGAVALINWAPPLAAALASAARPGVVTTWRDSVIIIDPTLPACPTEDSVSCVWINPRTGVVVINGPQHR